MTIYSSRATAKKDADKLSRYVSEATKCKNSFEYFCENYLEVRGLGTMNPVKMKLWPQQKKLLAGLDAAHSIICKHPRQSGITTFMSARTVWIAMFQPMSQIGFARRIYQLSSFDVIPQMLAAIPSWMKLFCNSSILTSTQTNIILSNGSCIRMLPFSDVSPRGLSLSHAFIDDFANQPNMMVVPFLNNLLPAMSSKGGPVLLASTPSSITHAFYTYWTRAQAGMNQFTPVEISFWDLHNASTQRVNWLKQVIGEKAFENEYLGQFDDEDS